MKKDLKKYVEALEKNAKHGDIYTPAPKKGKKKKEKGLSNKVLYDLTLPNFQFHMYELILMINNIDLDYYVYADRTATALNANLKIDDTFKQLSSLDWDTPKGINTLTFRGRFATILLLRVARNAHTIVKNLYKRDDSDKKWKSYRAFLDELICRVDYFITTFLSNNFNYDNHLQSILEMVAISEGVDPEVVFKFQETKEFLKKAVRSKGKYEDSIITNDIMKLAFLLSTQSMKIKHTPEYMENIDFKNDRDILYQVGTLGFAIMQRRKKDDEIPTMYRILQKANPEMWSRFLDVDEHPELIVGTRALEMLKLFMDDEQVSGYINKIQCIA